jgi:cbb3-type cytochrome oxidase maturation protein
MDILFLLIPFSVVLVLVILGGLWWAVERGQFEDVEGEGERRPCGAGTLAAIHEKARR